MTEQKEKQTERQPVKLKQHFMRGFTAFLVVVACIACYFAFLRMDDIANLFGKIAKILQPIIIGLAFAYLLNPLVKKIECYVKPFLEKRMKKKTKLDSISRTIGITGALLLTTAVVVLLLNMVIPELYKSIRDMVISLPGQINQAMDFLAEQNLSDTAISGTLATVLENAAASLEAWVRTDLIRQVNQMMSSVTVGVLSFFETLFNIAIGVIVSVYVLTGKEKFMAQGKRITYALFPQERANLVLHITRKSNEIFGGFVIGKIIDSIIIGIICFVILSILNMPYTLLVSVIVGVTNVIPFFGPFIGAIPSIILIFLAEPIQGLYFLVIILLLQQFDGNILGPKILGDSTGLSAFWVVFSILLGGGLFGFIGMVMGVPTFAVIYYLADMFVERKLMRRKLPTESEKYEDMDYVDDKGKLIYIDKKNEEAEQEVKEEE